MRKNARILITGHTGLVGSAMQRRLTTEGFSRVRGVSRQDLDLRDQVAVRDLFRAVRPHFVFHFAGTVGGILANDTRPAEFLYDNIMMQSHVFEAARHNDVRKLLFLGSSCMYPREASQPIKEDAFLTGPLEPTNAAYAVAKIAGIKLCQSYHCQYGCRYISAAATNLYGPHDRFDAEQSHVIPALMLKFHKARIENRNEIVVWGSGSPLREFMHVDDLVDGCLYLMRHYDHAALVNIGTGQETSIRDLAQMLKQIIHPNSKIVFDSRLPDGMPRKLMDSSRLYDLGWRHKIDLEDGLRSTYDWLKKHLETLG